MKSATYDSLGCKVNFAVPESPEEFDKLAERVGACVEEANDNVAYRGVLADFRYALCEAIEGETSNARGVEPVIDAKTNKPKTGKDGQPVTKYTEKESEYVNRIVLVEKALTKERLQQIADDVSKTLVFDPKQQTRSTGSKLAKVYSDAANEIIAKGGAEKAAGRLAEILGRPVTPDANSLALAIKENEDRKRKDRVNELLA